ncbi:Crp/Fnr family transcriptional regulator [Bradyrhizobium paxllaeri]|uniref:Crp/Fnr family transcriptional regulator n=1 Tax=Bradyrhizobium paxllaeri TaxID=190148 RepID=UPI000AB302B8
MAGKLANTWKMGANLGWADQARFGAMLMPDEKARGGGPAPLFQGLSAAEIQQVVSASKHKVYYRGAQVFSQGSPQDGIYLVESGRIRVFYIGPSGREITLAYWHPGNFVGGPDVFNRGIHVWSGAAAINSSVLHLPGDVLRQMVLKIPALALGIIEGLSFKGRCYSSLAQMLGTRSPTERLAHLLLHLTDLYGVKEHGGTLIAASFTHADLANMVGVTRQWVTITLKRLTEMGALDTHGTNILIKDTAPLAKMRDGKTARTGLQDDAD